MATLVSRINDVVAAIGADIKALQAAQDIFCRTTSSYTLANNTTFQKLLNVSTNGAVAVLANSSYDFECFFILTGMSATSGNVGFSIQGAGTASVSPAHWIAIGRDAATSTGTAAGAMGGMVATAEQFTNNIVTAATATEMYVLIKGTFVTGASNGTIIPSVKLTTAVATAAVSIGAYFKCRRLGASTGTVTQGTWT